MTLCLFLCIVVIPTMMFSSISSILIKNHVFLLGRQCKVISIANVREQQPHLSDIRSPRINTVFDHQDKIVWSRIYCPFNMPWQTVFAAINPNVFVRLQKHSVLIRWIKISISVFYTFYWKIKKIWYCSAAAVTLTYFHISSHSWVVWYFYFWLLTSVKMN